MFNVVVRAGHPCRTETPIGRRAHRLDFLSLVSTVNAMSRDGHQANSGKDMRTLGNARLRRTPIGCFALTTTGKGISPLSYAAIVAGDAMKIDYIPTADELVLTTDDERIHEYNRIVRSTGGRTTSKPEPAKVTR